MAKPDAVNRHSSGLEKILEHRFVAALTTTLWLEGCRDLEVLRSEVDDGGYDIVVEARGIQRHVQLKSMTKGGRKSSVSVNRRLSFKPSGCVIWFDYDPVTLVLGPFRWFGHPPGLPLPDPGERIARHSKADATGIKKGRPAHRVLTKSRFVTIDTIEQIAVLLFGRLPREEIGLLEEAICEAPDTTSPYWVHAVANGQFHAIPDDLDWQSSVHLAHLIDGYAFARVVGITDPFAFEELQLGSAVEYGRWSGGPVVLWLTLFLEHRRWRMSPFPPDPGSKQLLDRLCQQLVTALKLQTYLIP